MSILRKTVYGIFTLMFAAAALSGVVQASERSEAQETVAKSVASIERINNDQNFVDHFSDELARARGVLVIPSFYKGAFFIGGNYGNGVLSIRDDSGAWSSPAFYRMAGGSLGFQIGGQEAQILFMIMTDKGLDAVLKDQFKVGASIGVSFITAGANMEAATTSNMNADIIAFAIASGAFGGGAIEGSAITPLENWNHAFYGPNASPKAILFDRRYPLGDLGGDLARALDVASKREGMNPATRPMTGGQPTQQSQPMGTAPATDVPPPYTGEPNDQAPIQLAPVDRQSLQ